MHSSTVAVALEVEVEVQDAALKGGLEAFLVAVLPLLIEDLEGDVLVGRPRVEYEQARTAMLVRIWILLPDCIRITRQSAQISILIPHLPYHAQSQTITLKNNPLTKSNTCAEPPIWHKHVHPRALKPSKMPMSGSRKDDP